jgi:hypothetical protein
MNSNKNNNFSWRLILHINHLKEKNQESGYAMLVTSVLAILVFSMLSVYLFSANLYKSVASNIVDSSTTFYTAEHGLNERAYAVRKEFDDYGSPTGTPPAGVTPADQMQSCITSNPIDKAVTSNDFECRLKINNYREATVNQSVHNSLLEDYNSYHNKKEVKYRTYSFVRDITSYSNPARTQVDFSKIPVGDDYAGLNALEYRYRVYTTAAKEIDNKLAGNTPSISAQTMLQMDFNNRLIPLFQFAVFYEKDLEIANGPDFTIEGPVHTNSNLYLSPDKNKLTFNGNVTSVGRIYKSLKVATRPPGTIAFNGGTSVTSVATTGTLMTQADIDGSNRLKANQRLLKLPPSSLLTRTGEYYEDADMRVDFAPGTTNPVRVRAFGNNLSNAAANSLLQPILVRIQAHGSDGGLAEATRLCSKTTLSDKSEPSSAAQAIPALPLSLTNLNLDNNQKIAVVNALQKAMLNPNNPVLAYSGIQSSANGILLTNLDTELNALSVLGSGATKTNIINILKAARLDQIAALQPTIPAQNSYGACLVPAPMQILTKRDRRENRNINLLQSSIKSLTIWNREGYYWEGSTWTSAANKLFPRKLGIEGTAPASSLPAATVPVKATSACNYDCMGLSSDDTTQGGLVWHYSIDRSNPSYNYTSGNGEVRGGNSVYGFAFTEGRRLPGALTLATDQAAYIQGDFNNPSNIEGDVAETTSGLADSFKSTTSPSREKRPASVLADTVAILSNSCSDNSRRIDCMRDAGAGDADTAKDDASDTVVRAGLLFKTDQSVSQSEQSGQLENSIRFLENWSGKTSLYRGSIVSLGIPTEYRGIWDNNDYYDPPKRDWGFDSDFNSAVGLPPMTPRVTYLKQKVFRRDYDTKDRSYNPVTGSNPH